MFDKYSEMQFMSHTGQNIIKPLIYLPDDEKNIKGVLLLIHGMAEHQLRYADFAEYISANSWVVCSFDLPGHGTTAKDESQLGFFAEHDSNRKVMADVEQIFSTLIEYFPEKPIFLLGHSMGSLIARQFCAVTRQPVSGAIYSGTVAPNALIGLAVWLSRRSIKKHGHYYRDMSLDKLMHRGFSRLIPDIETAFDWISKDKSVVREYIDDPLCGYIFTANGFYTLFTWLKQVSDKKWACSVPQNMPILLFSGDHDPVGGFGKGVKIVHKWLEECGHHASLKLYPGGRHEMLNEPEKILVWQDVLNWLDVNIQ